MPQSFDGSRSDASSGNHGMVIFFFMMVMMYFVFSFLATANAPKVTKPQRIAVNRNERY